MSLHSVVEVTDGKAKRPDAGHNGLLQGMVYAPGRRGREHRKRAASAGRGGRTRPTRKIRIVHRNICSRGSH